MSEFRIGLMKVLGDAEVTYANGYEVETTYFGAGEATLDLADETQLTFHEQEVVVDESGEATAIDEGGEEVSLRFQSAIPYKPAEMRLPVKVVVLLGDQPGVVAVTSNVAAGVLVIKQSSSDPGSGREDEFLVTAGDEAAPKQITVVGEVSHSDFSQANAAFVESAFEAEKLNRETFFVDVFAVPEDGTEFSVGRWVATGCRTEEEASKQAIEEVWDSRLDGASCSPRTVVRRNPRWEESLEEQGVSAEEIAAAID